MKRLFECAFYFSNHLTNNEKKIALCKVPYNYTLKIGTRLHKNKNKGHSPRRHGIQPLWNLIQKGEYEM